MFTVKTKNHPKGFFVEQVGAKFGDRDRLVSILKGSGNVAQSVTQANELIKKQFE